MNTKSDKKIQIGEIPWANLILPEGGTYDYEAQLCRPLNGEEKQALDAYTDKPKKQKEAAKIMWDPTIFAPSKQ